MASRQELETQAIRALQRGDLTRAQGIFAQLIEEDPDDVRTVLKLGDTCVKANRRDDANTAYQCAVDIYVAQGFLLKGLAVLKQMLRVDNGAIDARRQLIDLYRELGLLQDALAHAQQLAKTLNELGLVDEAAEAMDLALDAASPGHNATQASLKRRIDARGAALKLDVGTLRESWPVRRGPFLFAAGASAFIVPAGGGAYRVETSRMRAFELILADVDVELALTEVVALFRALRGRPLSWTSEPAHVEDGALVFAARPERDTLRIRVDTRTLAVSASTLD